MPASFQKILSSRQFKFLVGTEVDGRETEFSIQEEAVAQLSKPLEKMMRGGEFAESKAGCTTWKDVKRETFERCVQFAYTGDYSIPEPIIRITEEQELVETPTSTVSQPVEVAWDEPAPMPPEFDVPGDGWSFGPTSKAPKFTKKGKSVTRDKVIIPNIPALVQDFRSLAYPLYVPRINCATDCDPISFFRSFHSYSNVFLSHATLYVLGDLWLIDSLKALALHKLHQTLCVFELDDMNVKDILELAIYTYTDEGRGGEEGIGALRTLVCQYMALNAVVLNLNDGFMEMLDGGGQFVGDLWKFLVQRLL